MLDSRFSFPVSPLSSKTRRLSPPSSFATPNSRQYDQDYLTYLRDLLSLLPQYGLTAFIAIHQDVFSRLSGGSGAPGWTLESVGFDLSEDGIKLEQTEGAYLGGVRGGKEEKEEDSGRWPTGYLKLVASTMKSVLSLSRSPPPPFLSSCRLTVLRKPLGLFVWSRSTCFWAGDTLAAKLRIERPTRDGKGTETVGIQTYLQEAFLDAVDVLAEKVGHLEGVIGFEVRLLSPGPCSHAVFLDERGNSLLTRTSPLLLLALSASQRASRGLHRSSLSAFIQLQHGPALSPDAVGRPVHGSRRRPRPADPVLQALVARPYAQEGHEVGQ